jgi:iron complex transport system ATP-binding protein
VNDTSERPIPGVAVRIDAAAVLVSSERDLSILSSAVAGGGYGRYRAIVNMHVDDRYTGECPEEDLAAFAASLGVPGPFVGLMTAAYTQFARVAVESLGETTVAAVVSVGLSNTTCAGVTPPVGAGPSPPPPGTINVILLVDADLSPAAMVNAVITATEAKTMTLAEWDVATPHGDPASGTSTDAVVVACTGRGEKLSYAGPATTVGWLAARAVRAAMSRICREKLARDGGRRIGW